MSLSSKFSFSNVFCLSSPIILYVSQTGSLFQSIQWNVMEDKQETRYITPIHPRASKLGVLRYLNLNTYKLGILSELGLGGLENCSYDNWTDIRTNKVFKLREVKLTTANTFVYYYIKKLLVGNTSFSDTERALC